MTTLEQFLIKNRMYFTIHGQSGTPFTPIREACIKEGKVRGSTFESELRLDYDARALGFLDTLDKLYLEHGIDLSKWEVAIFQKLIKAKPEIGITLFEEDGMFHGVLHMGIIPVDILPDMSEFTYSPKRQNNKQVEANNHHNLMSRLCAVYAESLIGRIENIDATIAKAQETRKRLQAELMDFSYGDMEVHLRYAHL